MTQRLHCSYQDLQAMPEHIYDLYRAFLSGEARLSSEKAADARVARRA